jgi:transposase
MPMPTPIPSRHWISWAGGSDVRCSRLIGAGYRALAGWLAGHGEISAVGVEGTGSYGAGLTRWLSAHQIKVVEVNRPNRADRRRRGKSDPVDAEHAAAAVLANTATAVPKARTGLVESIRLIHATRAGAVKARTAAQNSFINTLRTSPDAVREALQPLTPARQLRAATGYRALGDGPVATVKLCLHRLAVRITELTTEIQAADQDLDRLTRQLAPAMRSRPGFGPETTAQLLITAGDNLDRIGSEAALAGLCGVSPVQASSGKTRYRRLNRGGDRQANRALHMIILCRLRHHQPTRAYLAGHSIDGHHPAPTSGAQALPGRRGLPAARRLEDLTAGGRAAAQRQGTGPALSSACPGAAEAPRSRAARPSRSDRTATLEVGESGPVPSRRGPRHP